jgi:response regulator RpfG family c-di-GMP phosphodiesterase
MDYRKQPLTQALSSCLKRVLIVDPNSAAVSILSDLLQQIGSVKIFRATKTIYALEMARDINPDLIITEFFHEGFDGMALVQDIRRSTMRCRQVPIIVMTTDATQEIIHKTRNSGVNEFLLKPFTAKDLYRRTASAMLGERAWVERKNYIGPDRRRTRSETFSGFRKRQCDTSLARPKNRLSEILSNMKASIERVETDPLGVAQELLKQAEELNTISAAIQDFGLAQASLELKNFVTASVKAGGLTKANMRKHAANIFWAMSAVGMPTHKASDRDQTRKGGPVP